MPRDGTSSTARLQRRWPSLSALRAAIATPGADKLRRKNAGPDAVDWYTWLFDRAPDVVAHDREVMWRVTEGGWLYVLEDAERAGRGVVSIAAPDLDVTVRELAARAIRLGARAEEGQ